MRQTYLKDMYTSLADRRMQDYCIVINKALNNEASRYIRALMEERSTTKNLHVRGTRKLVIPRVQKTTYGLHSFIYQTPKLWNSLTDGVRTTETTVAFKNKITRTIDFNQKNLIFSFGLLVGRGVGVGGGRLLILAYI